MPGFWGKIRSLTVFGLVLYVPYICAMCFQTDYMLGSEHQLEKFIRNFLQAEQEN